MQAKLFNAALPGGELFILFALGGNLNLQRVDPLQEFARSLIYISLECGLHEIDLPCFGLSHCFLQFFDHVILLREDLREDFDLINEWCDLLHYLLTFKVSIIFMDYLNGLQYLFLELSLIFLLTMLFNLSQDFGEVIIYRTVSMMNGKLTVQRALVECLFVGLWPAVLSDQ